MGAAVMVAKIATGDIEDDAAAADKARHRSRPRKRGAYKARSTR